MHERQAVLEHDITTNFERLVQGRKDGAFKEELAIHELEMNAALEEYLEFMGETALSTKTTST